MPGVAVEGEVKATPAGGWKAGPVTYSSYRQLKINGVGVIHQAVCIFTKDNSPPSRVVLEATRTPLQRSTSRVLRQGDTATDAAGNNLTVVITRRTPLTA